MRQILRMSIIATSGMTLFSYISSLACREKFLETTLLNQLVFPAQKEEKKHHVTGYILHYAVGFFFSSLYYLFWKKTSALPKASTSLSLGFVNGLAGILGWDAFFTLHPDPPKVNLGKYYLQLLAAHVIFGYLNGRTFKKKDKKDE